MPKTVEEVQVVEVLSWGEQVSVVGTASGWYVVGAIADATADRLELHPRLAYVAAEDTEGFWRALAPSMAVHPLDGEGCRFVSAGVAAHIAACGLCRSAA